MNSNPTANTSASASASADAISRRAYELWENEGRPEGCDLRHWLQAEQEVAAHGTQGTAGAAPSANGTARSAEAGSRAANTDRPLSNKGTSAKRGTTAPFERAPSSGGGAQPAGTKRR